MKKTLSALISLTLIFSASLIAAAPKYPEAVISENIEKKTITIWSDGRALDGDIYRPKNLSEEHLAPAIVTSHGWGGDKKTASRYAAAFAENGFIVLTFTHSSWGNSSGNTFVKQDGDDGIQTVKELIDPIDWIQNVRSAIDFLEGEPNVDPSKIGAWGTSFGGGVVVTLAANDDRIASLVTQVAAFPTLEGPKFAHAKQRAIDIARGNIPAIPEGIDGIPGLKGTPHLARFLQYDPMAAVSSLDVPTLLIAAGNEQLFKNELNSGKAYETLKAKTNIQTQYEVIPNIDHYGIYFDGYKKGSELALAWFTQSLK